MSVIPFSFAWYLAKNPDSLTLGTNHGELVKPLITTELKEFSGFDTFSAENLKELQGHWVLINLVTHSSCSSACQDALFKTRQLSLMLGKDISRIRRAAIIFKTSEQTVLSQEWLEDGHLLKILAEPSLQEKITKIVGNFEEDGGLLIMDPLGNLMMKYPTGYDPYKVKDDLSKLLKISQIG